MNRENILKVADAIEAACQPDAKPEIGFNMSDYNTWGFEDKTGHNCGTSACIAGWAQFLFVEKGHERTPFFDGANTLGLDEGQAVDLFVPEPGGSSLKEIEAEHAVAVLRHLADTGEVDWSIGAPQTEGAA